MAEEVTVTEVGEETHAAWIMQNVWTFQRFCEGCAAHLYKEDGRRCYAICNQCESKAVLTDEQKRIAQIKAETEARWIKDERDRVENERQREKAMSLDRDNPNEEQTARAKVIVCKVAVSTEEVVHEVARLIAERDWMEANLS